MAEEKKFLDETMEQPKNRKLVAKNVVLAFVVFVILLLCVLAWFSAKNDANASGLSVKTTGASGLEVSLDGGHTWGTSWSSKDGVEGSIFSPALAKYDSTDSENGGSLMQLLSGNGRRLFYTKSVDADGNVEDKDFVEISDDKAGDYCLEFEAYFRSENQCSVALTDQSKVEPFNLTDNMWTQSTSSFSANYIAGAARVAFLEENMNDPKQLIKTGLWIPNPLYELTSEAGSETTYEKMPDNFGGNVSTSEGGKPTDTTVNSSYYLWTSSIAMKSSLGYVENKRILDNMYAIPMIKVDGKEDEYYCQFVTVEPINERYEQIFTINNSKDTNSWIPYTQSSTDDYKKYIKELKSGEDIDTQYWNIATDNDIDLYISQDSVYDGYKECTQFRFRKIYFNQNKPVKESKRLVKFVYNSTTGTVTFGKPDNSTVTITNNKNTQKLEKDACIVVTKTIGDELLGMTCDTLNALSPGFDQGNSSCDLIVDSFIDDSSSGARSYKLRFSQSTTTTYLAVIDGALTTVSDESQASYFYIIVNEDEKDSDGISEKLLAYIATDSNGNQRIKYITLSNEKYDDNGNVYNSPFTLSSLELKDVGSGYMIYQKVEKNFTKYGMLTDITTPKGTQESTYYYFNGTTKAALGNGEYKTSPSDCTDLVQLTTVNTDMEQGKTYYTGKMKVRIFAEGFDREAKKPMEKGKIKVSLQFIAT